MCLSHPFPPPAVAGPTPLTFTINFTVTNLEYVKEMGHPGSRKFNATERTLQRLVRYPPQCIKPHPQVKAALRKTMSWPWRRLLNPQHSSHASSVFPQLRALFSKTSLGPLYSGCRLTLLRWDPYNIRLRTAEIVQSMKYLLTKHEDLSLIPNIPLKSPGVMACACQPSTGAVDTGGFLGLTGQQT